MQLVDDNIKYRYGTLYLLIAISSTYRTEYTLLLVFTEEAYHWIYAK